MPKTTKSDKGTFVKAEFINYPLSSDEMAVLKKETFTDEQFVNGLERICDSGYKISVGRDEYHDCYAAFLTPQQPNNPNNGFILTGRGSTPSKAVKQLLFIHFHILDGDWVSAGTRSRFELDD